MRDGESSLSWQAAQHFVFMIVIGTDILDAFAKRHAQAQKPLQAWLLEARQAKWKTPQDIKQRYRSADFLSDNRVMFDIKGNSYRLIVRVRYEGATVVVQWVGTHAEYDRQRF